MKANEKKQIEDQIARQTAELENYKPAIESAKVHHDDLLKKAKPFVDKMVALEAGKLAFKEKQDADKSAFDEKTNSAMIVQQAALQELAPAIDLSRAERDAMISNAAALERAILGCKALLKLDK